MSDVDVMDLHRVVAELRNIKGALGKAILDLRKAGEHRALTARMYEAHAARARLHATGSVQAKQDAALIDRQCMELRIRMDVAKEAEAYQKARARSLESDQSNLQTQAKLIDTAMRLAGVS